ncbi:helix-turn-helix domain-containing protein [Nonomuraea antri]|uniref:helix-turn-helix domain-containing protein n=1 Tax=Nonomuraea antri TaxID=2730852 RepID=UPI0015685AE7|nr:helix-turn-helix transcriptional regulator [Nonomuraea antri]
MRPAKELDPGAGTEARFGYELRRIRLKAGLTQHELGDKIGFSGNLIGSVERAVRRPSRGLAARCEDVLCLEPGTLIELLPVCKRESLVRTLHPWLGLEAAASELLAWEPTLVPGLLQTEGYARAVLRGRPGVSADQVEEAVATRMARQEIFDRDEPPALRAVIDESMLFRPIGDETTTRDQLAHLAKMARHPAVTLRVLPFSARVTAGMMGGFIIARTPGRPDIAFVDSPAKGKVVHVAVEVEMLEQRHARCQAEALPPDLSLRRIEERSAQRKKGAPPG